MHVLRGLVLEKIESRATFTFRRRTEEKSSSGDAFSKHREKEQLWVQEKCLHFK